MCKYLYKDTLGVSIWVLLAPQSPYLAFEKEVLKTVSAGQNKKCQKRFIFTLLSFII